MIVACRKHKNIIMHGNSLMNLYANSTTQGGHYCATKIYENLILLGMTKVNLVNLSINGNPTATKIANWTTQTAPIIQPFDVVVLWEIQNDVSAGWLTGAQAYANLVTFANLVRAVGAKIVVGTATARNHTLDTTQFTRNSDCNTLVRADTTSFDLIVDIGGQSGFSLQSDCTGANYQADKLHHSTTGSDNAATYFANQIYSSGVIG